MRLVIIGQKWLAVELLQQCVDDGYQVAQVISPPGDGLAARSQALGVPVVELRGALEAHQVPACDIILAAHAHAYVTPGARSQASIGALGYHPSLLPRHRGRDAIRWALHMREPITGGTLYWMDDGADTGPVALQDWCHIRPDDTPVTLWRRELGPMGLRLFKQALARMRLGESLPAIDQDHSIASWEPAWSGGRLCNIHN